MATFIVHIRPKESFNREIFDTHMRTYSNWARFGCDLWMISYNGNAAQVRDTIAHATNKTCEVMAINISGDGWATLNVDRRLTDWMTENV